MTTLRALAKQDTLLLTQMFLSLPARATFVAETKKNVSDFVQEHFVSTTNVSQLCSPRNIMGNMCSCLLGP